MEFTNISLYVVDLSSSSDDFQPVKKHFRRRKSTATATDVETPTPQHHVVLSGASSSAPKSDVNTKVKKSRRRLV
jgi:hypothetical protein